MSDISAESVRDEWCAEYVRVRDQLAVAHTDNEALRKELADAQTIIRYECAEADVQIARRIEVEAELAAKDARIAELEVAGKKLQADLAKARLLNLDWEDSMDAKRFEREQISFERARAERAEGKVRALREELREVLVVLKLQRT